MRIFLHIVIHFILIFFSLQLFSQDYGTIKGKIKDENDKPVFPVTISIENESFGALTNEDGYFEFKIPSNRKLIISFSHLGFETTKDTIFLKGGEIIQLNKQLKVRTEELDDVIIYSRYDRAPSLVQINIKSIDKLPAPAGNFEDILKTFSFVISNNELSSQYSVRGGSYDENLIYVNDIEIARPLLVQSAQQEGLSFVNPYMISAIQFSAGAFNAQYGDKMSSVLDIKYKKPIEYKASISASLLGGSVNLEGASKNRKFTHISSVRYKTTQNLLKTLDIEGEYKPVFFDFQTYLTYSLSKKTEISFLGNLSQNKFNLIPVTRSTKFGTFQETKFLTAYYEGQEEDMFTTYLGAMSLTYQPNDKLGLKIIGSASSSYEAITYDILSQYRISEIYNDSSINIGIGGILEHARNYLFTNMYSLSHKGTYYYNNNNLKWGLIYRYETINDKISQWEMVDSAGYMLSVPDQTIRSENSIFSSRFSAYIQHTFNFNISYSETFFTMGLRGHYSTLNFDYIVSPRISLSIIPAWQKNIQFNIATGIYYQPPFYKELRGLQGNIHKNTKAQRSVHYVVGGDYKFMAWNRPFVFSTEMYFKYITNLIPYKIEDVQVKYLTQWEKAKGYATGIDLRVYGEFVEGSESWVSISIMQTQEDIFNDYYQKRDGTVVYPGYYRRPTDQLINFGLFFQDYLPSNPDYKLHLTLLFGSGLPYGSTNYNIPSQIYSLGSYERVDIGLSKALKSEYKKVKETSIFKHFKNLWINVEILNLLDKKNKASYDWIKTIENNITNYSIWSVPNYLTGRRFNLKITAEF